MTKVKAWVTIHRILGRLYYNTKTRKIRLLIMSLQRLNGRLWGIVK